MYGAYDLGALKTLASQKVKIDSIYTGSSGVFASSYYASGQIEEYEELWRQLQGKDLMKIRNLLRMKRIMDLSALMEGITRGPFYLDVRELLHSETNLIYSLTHYPSGKASYFSAKNHPEQLLDIIQASAALYPLHAPVEVYGARYIDGELGDPLPIAKALGDGHDEIIVIGNKPLADRGFDRFWTFASLVSPFFPDGIESLVRSHIKRLGEAEKLVLESPNVLSLRPGSELPLKSLLDHNARRLEACMQIGSRDARFFIKGEVPPVRRKVRFNWRYRRRLKKKFYRYMLGTEEKQEKYGSYYRALRSYKYAAFSLRRGNFLEWYNIAMRLADEVADSDLKLPKGYSSRAEFLEEKIAWLDELSEPRDKIEVILLYCHELSTRLGFDIIQETRYILSSLLFDAKRRETASVFPEAELHESFHRLDVEGAISCTLKVMEGDEKLLPLIAPLGYASRIYYNLRDYEEDIAAGLINVSSEDCKKYQIPIHSDELGNRLTPAVRAWFEDQSRLGLTLIEKYKSAVEGEKIGRIARVSLNGFEKKAKAYFETVLTDSL